MTFQSIVFYFLSAVLLFAGVRMITTKNPVAAALFLVLAFFTAAGLWLMLEAEFLAITLVLVYVGAVSVLFLFVVMMLDINIARLREGFWKYFPVATLVAVIMAIEMVLVLGARNFGLDKVPAPAPHAQGYSNTRELGSVLYTDYVYAFEIAAVMLLIAIIAAIALTLRDRKGTKYQNPSMQVAVKRNDRVRLVKMPAVTQEEAPSEASLDNGGKSLPAGE